MKAMKTSIVLKMLTGAAIAVLTVTGIAVSVINGSSQNMADISVITETDSQVAAAIVNAKITSNEINVVEYSAEEIKAKSRYIVNGEQSTDVALADVQSDNAVVAADKQKSDIVKKPHITQQSDTINESDIKQQSDAAKESDTVKDSDIESQSDIVKESVTAQQSDAIKESVTAQQSDIVKKSDAEQPSNDVQQPSVEQKSDITQQSEDTDEQAGNKGNPNVATDTATCTITGVVSGNPDAKVPDVPEVPTIEVPVEDEDCVVGHRYCVCGASFDFRKNSGLDEASWMTHVREHVANGEMVRWTDK